MSRSIVRDRAARHTRAGAVRPAFTCPTCRRDTWLSRKEARIALRQRRHLTPTHEVYGCPSGDSWFHIGLPPTT